MAQQFSETDIKRITFLSLINAAASAGPDSAYETATEWLIEMEKDGYFEDAPKASPKPKPTLKPSSDPSPSSEQEACPECVEQGRDGVVIDNPDGRGPARTCSLRERKKFGSTYRDVGECDWKDWGDRYS